MNSHTVEDPRLRAAQRALAGGDWNGAARRLEEAAANLHRQGDGLHAAHCLQMVAALRRASGDTALALAAADRVGQAHPGDPRARFAAQAERAQALDQAGDWAAAAAAWQAALVSAQTLDLPALPRSTVRRRLAASLAHAERYQEAWRQFDEAAEEIAGDTDLAPWVDVEQARCALELAQDGRADEVLDRARLTRAAQDAPHLYSEWQATLAARALALGDYAAARDRADAARTAALAAVAPVSYFTAAATLAQAYAGLERHVEAYAALATAWATLADLLGNPVAESWIRPLIEAQRWQWGSQRFDQARGEYEARRRRQLADEHGRGHSTEDAA